MVLPLLAACAAEEVAGYDADDLAAELEGYTELASPEGWDGVRPSCDGAHGAYVRIWVNDVALADVERGSGDFSDGALLVKEGYQDEGVTSKGLDAMRKVAGYDATAGDWFWGHYGEDGEPIATGRVTGCTGCHGEGRDYVRFVGSAVVETADDCPQ